MNDNQKIFKAMTGYSYALDRLESYTDLLSSDDINSVIEYVKGSIENADLVGL